MDVNQSMIKNNIKRIWITTDWEANPLMNGAPQLGRMNNLADYLAKKGYLVTLWFTTYSHPEKKHLYDKTQIVNVSENEKIVALHSKVVYKKNTSPTRFLYHSCLAKEMKRLVKNQKMFPKPDLIFCSYPTEQFCRVSLDYGKKNNIPVIMDARDMWPDIFERAFPKKISGIAHLLLLPMKRQAAKDFSKATAICASNPIALQWALDYAGRDSIEFDRSIFIGCSAVNISEDKKKQQYEFFEGIGISKTSWNICLFSTLSKTALNIDTLIDAVKIVYEQYPQIRLIIGGTGDDDDRIKTLTKDIPYIQMLGWMNSDQMAYLMSISKMGSLCYRNTKDFKNGWGNKVGQYLSAGLPLLTSAEGLAKKYIEKNDCGIFYKEDKPDELAKIIIRLIEKPDIVHNLSINAYRKYIEDFELESICKKFEKMIQDVCNVYNS